MCLVGYALFKLRHNILFRCEFLSIHHKDEYSLTTHSATLFLGRYCSQVDCIFHIDELFNINNSTHCLPVMIDMGNEDWLQKCLNVLFFFVSIVISFVHCDCQYTMYV